MRFLWAISSTVSLPSEMMPTLAAMARAVIGWSPVTMTTWNPKIQTNVIRQGKTCEKIWQAYFSILDCFMCMWSNADTPWYQQYDISSLHQVQWLSGGQSLRWDQRSTILTWWNSSHRCRTESLGETLSHSDRCDRNLEGEKKQQIEQYFIQCTVR